MNVRIVHCVFENDKEYYKVQYKKYWFLPIWYDFQKESITENGELAYIKWYPTMEDAWYNYVHGIYSPTMKLIKREIEFKTNVELLKK